jgi:hypothetical protein
MSSEDDHSTEYRHLPVELLCLRCDLKINVLLLCSPCQPIVPSHPRLGTPQQASNRQRSLTEIIDVKDATNGTTRPAMLDLALCWRSWGVVNGRIDLAEGLAGHDFCGHD